MDTTLFGLAGAVWLPVAFTVLMGVSMLVYVVLDGFDLGVGMLLPRAEAHEQDLMVSSIGPFWDANETWLVLGIGLLLVAFPAAHGTILTALYLPVSAMLLGLILRGVAFEFRAKAPAAQKAWWNRCFFAGSTIASFAQGFMLGLYIMGLDYTPGTVAFAILIGLSVCTAYTCIGAGWLVMKTSGELQRRATGWARLALIGVVVAMVAISAATPAMSPRVFDKWFSFPQMLLLAPLPLMSTALVAVMFYALRHLPATGDRWNWVPFVSCASLFAFAYGGMAYSFYPYIVPGELTIYEAASAPQSLLIIFIGACVVLPVIAAYSVLAYTVFRGKARALSYD